MLVFSCFTWALQNTSRKGNKSITNIYYIDSLSSRKRFPTADLSPLAPIQPNKIKKKTLFRINISSQLSIYCFYFQPVLVLHKYTITCYIYGLQKIQNTNDDDRATHVITTQQRRSRGISPSHFASNGVHVGFCLVTLLPSQVTWNELISKTENV